MTEEYPISMQISEIECWSCKKLMLMSMVLNYWTWYGPDRYSAEQLEFARSKGVLIKKVYMRSMDEFLNGNVCGNCNAFLGQHYLVQYMYMKDDTELFRIDELAEQVDQE